MEFSGAYGFHLSPDLMWQKLNDPEFLRAVIPNCKKFQPREENIYDVASALGVGPLSLTLRGTVRLKPLQTPTVYKMSAMANSWLGTTKGSALVNLLPHENGVIFRYRAGLVFSSGVAKIGASALSGSVDSVVDRFFHRLAIQLQTTLFDVDELTLGAFIGEMSNEG